MKGGGGEERGLKKKKKESGGKDNNPALIKTKKDIITPSSFEMQLTFKTYQKL